MNKTFSLNEPYIGLAAALQNRGYIGTSEDPEVCIGMKSKVTSKTLAVIAMNQPMIPYDFEIPHFKSCRVCVDLSKFRHGPPDEYFYYCHIWYRFDVKLNFVEPSPDKSFITWFIDNLDHSLSGKWEDKDWKAHYRYAKGEVKLKIENCVNQRYKCFDFGQVRSDIGIITKDQVELLKRKYS